MSDELLLTPVEIEKVAKQVSEAHYHEDIRLSAKEYIEALPKAICQAQLSKATPIIEKQERESIVSLAHDCGILCHKGEAEANNCVFCKKFWDGLKGEQR
jgi:hypothetical protein